MTSDELRERLERARELLREIPHVALATTDADGAPHLSPVFAAHDEALHFFWASNPETEHSKNIARTGQVFISIFDSRVGHGGLHLQASAHEITDPAQLHEAYELYSKLADHAIGTLEHYSQAGPERLYEAIPHKLWVNKSDRNEHGIIIRDRRYEVTVAQLTSRN